MERLVFLVFEGLEVDGPLNEVPIVVDKRSNGPCKGVGHLAGSPGIRGIGNLRLDSLADSNVLADRQE